MKDLSETQQGRQALMEIVLWADQIVKAGRRDPKVELDEPDKVILWAFSCLTQSEVPGSRRILDTLVKLSDKSLNEQGMRSVGGTHRDTQEGEVKD